MTVTTHELTFHIYEIIVAYKNVYFIAQMRSFFKMNKMHINLDFELHYEDTYYSVIVISITCDDSIVDYRSEILPVIGLNPDDAIIEKHT